MSRDHIFHDLGAEGLDIERPLFVLTFMACCITSISALDCTGFTR